MNARCARIKLKLVLECIDVGCACGMHGACTMWECLIIIRHVVPNILQSSYLSQVVFISIDIHIDRTLKSIDTYYKNLGRSRTMVNGYF